MGGCGAGDTEGDFVEAGDAVFGDVFKLGGEVLVELVRELEGGGELTPQQFMEKTRIVGGSVGEAIVVGYAGGLGVG